ncbi:hypothetical protein, conserved [Eimeria acervulina]|uniref:V-type proton ATPase subunit S1/VOA1 transmembrane domain-containing protein n=1 Tax=Eimeria acervulina TaxID=5801 RepID=U6GHE8_EIMAC|nr:hypothetical protein, conserved [Eimeria acervulina]CDI79676.1 hypothetical protein, conserved [Eimeria acervulina]
MNSLKALLALLLAITTVACAKAAASEEESSPFNYITANLLAQLLIMLILFLGSCIGVCCLMKIDTPSTFSDKPLVINKEY